MNETASIERIEKELSKKDIAVLLLLKPSGAWMYEGDIQDAISGGIQYNRLYQLGTWDRDFLVYNSRLKKKGKLNMDRWQFRWRLTGLGKAVRKKLVEAGWRLEDA